jgi:hypothetical protein
MKTDRRLDASSWGTPYPQPSANGVPLLPRSLAARAAGCHCHPSKTCRLASRLSPTDLEADCYKERQNPRQEGQAGMI